MSILGNGHAKAIAEVFSWVLFYCSSQGRIQPLGLGGGQLFFGKKVPPFFFLRGFGLLTLFGIRDNKKVGKSHFFGEKHFFEEKKNFFRGNFFFLGKNTFFRKKVKNREKSHLNRHTKITLNHIKTQNTTFRSIYTPK